MVKDKLKYVAYPLDSFDKKIDRKISKRGKDYFMEGRVDPIFQINAEEWNAVVQGFDDYNVFVKIEGDQLINWECNCSYREKDICKHVVAVLYFIRDEKHKYLLPAYKNFEEMKEELNYLPPHVLRYMILKFATRNNQFRKYVSEYLKTKK